MNLPQKDGKNGVQNDRVLYRPTLELKANVLKLNEEVTKMGGEIYIGLTYK